MNTNNNPSGDNNQPKMPKFNMNWIYTIIIVMLALLFFTDGGKGFFDGGAAGQEATYTKFQVYVDKGYARSVVVNKDNGTLRMYVRPDKIRDVFGKSAQQVGQKPYVEVTYGSVDGVDNYLSSAMKRGKILDFSYEKDSNSGLMTLFYTFGPIIFFVFLWLFMMRRMGGGGAGGGVFNVGKSKAQMYEKGNDLGITFKDVAGQVGAKQEVQEIVDFLKQPQKYTELGGKIPKGALLVGPPGTGKTLLAKAVAGEAGVPFFSMSGSDFVEMFVGVGASRVRDLFRQAKEKAPCIIFIDEIDAVGRARSKNPAMGGNDERENTLNALLTEMDGFGTNSGVIILAATNRADMLDKALLRAGRFDRQIHVDLPDLKERGEIFKVHLKGIRLADNFDVEFLAKHTPGFSGADIANVCNEAALTAARHNKHSVDKQDFLDAVDRIIGGLERKDKIITPAEKKSIAHHEAGHAVVSWLLPNANPLFKVTIVPRGQALGAAWYLPEERQLMTKEQMVDEMCSLIGGRVAEEIVNGQPSTGALNDLERLTKMAYSMVCYYGMSDKVGTVSFYDSTGSRGYELTRPYSERTAEVMDEEVKRIVKEIHDRTLAILTEHREEFLEVAALLLEKEVIFADDLERILGPRAGDDNGQTRSDEKKAKAQEEAEKSAEERHSGDADGSSDG